MAKKNPYKNIDLLNIRSKLCNDPALSDKFVSDVIRVTGYDIDSEGYVVDSEADPINPEYIVIRNKALRLSNTGVLHSTDLIFDPYNNPMIMSELFNRYCEESHPEVANQSIYAYDQTQVPKINTYGYITILLDSGAKIQTGLHWKDSTKYLDAFMRMESMTDGIIHESLDKYDIYENEFFKNLENEE